jgi:type IV secretory pathway VirD2 relaxase
MIAKGSYNRGNRQIGGARCAAHMKYIQYRSLGEGETREDRYIFSEDGDHVGRTEAVDDVMSHTSTAVNYHKIVLSPSEEEPVQDYQAWARDVMSDLEERQGKELHWYGVVHNNTDNPHVHIVLAGAGENKETGELEPVKLYASDYQFLRESGREHSEHEFYQHIQETSREYDRQDDLLPMMGPHHDRGDIDR